MTGPQDTEFRDDSDGDALRAAEYALRLMDPADVPAFEARLATDPVLRERVADWETGLAPLADEVAPVAPPAGVRARVLSAVAPDHPAPARAARPRRAGWLGWFGGLALAGSLAIGVLAVLPEVRIAPDAPGFAARIAAEDGSLVIRASVSGAVLRVERVAGAAPAGRVLELWLIAEGAAAPVSLGVLPSQSAAVLTLQDVSGFAGGTLAVSDEPLGGSPTGAPTGAVLAVGAITSL